MENPEIIGQAVTIVVIGVLNHFMGRKSDKRRDESLGRQFADLRAHTDTRFNEVHLELGDLRAHVIGPDGENGLRGDVRAIRSRVDGLEERERDRLADAAIHGRPDRRTT